MAISSNELNLWLLRKHVLRMEHYGITKTKESLSKAFNTSRTLTYIVSRDFCIYRWTNRSQSVVAIVIVQAVFMFWYSCVILCILVKVFMIFVCITLFIGPWRWNNKKKLSAMFSTHEQENWYLLSTNTSGAWQGKRTTFLTRWLAFIANCYKPTADCSGVVLRATWRILYSLSSALVTTTSVWAKFGTHSPSVRIPSLCINADKLGWQIRCEEVNVTAADVGEY